MAQNEVMTWRILMDFGVPATYDEALHLNAP